jgi:hypothetical protein
VLKLAKSRMNECWLQDFNNEEEKKMRPSNLLVTSALAVFIAAPGSSMAQQEGATQRSAPAEKIAPQSAPNAHKQGPDGRVGETTQSRGRSETTGQAPREERQNPAREHGLDQGQGKTEHSQSGQQQRPMGQAPRDDRSSEHDRTTGQAPRDERAGSPSQQNKVEQERERTGRTEGRETTGQGAAGTKSYSLRPETRTRIHEYVVQERNAPRVNSPNFEVSVGTKVPRNVPFRVLPSTIVDIEPAWRGFEYFLIGDQMVIVNPRTLEIVAVVDV